MEKKAIRMNAAKQMAVKRAGGKRLSPFGDVHSVREIEGIGPVYSKALEKMGITDTKQLWEADPDRITRKTEAPLSLVSSWQNMAELASVKDIGPQYSELLERSGVHNIEQLKGSTPNQLLKLVTDKQESLEINIQGNTPGHDLVENWIKQARAHRAHAI